MKPFFFVCLLALPASAAAPTGTPFHNAHLKNATAVGEVFAEGEKITAAVLEYDQPIDNAKLSPSAFSVKDRRILRVLAGTSDTQAGRGNNGRFVILELDPTDAEAPILGGDRNRPSGQAGPGGPGARGNPQMPGGGGGTRKPVKLTLTQTRDLTLVGGRKIAADPTSFETVSARNLIADDFQQLDFKDPVTGATFMYNLYVPRGYDRNKSYPLVLFMHDASVNSPDHDRTLIQGLGAVVWASPEEQAKHPSFVLAPQINGGAPRGDRAPGATIPGVVQGADTADLISRLMSHVTSEYNIDRNRMYTTGQSAGCTASLALGIKYPDLFAAYLFVAGQNDAGVTSVLKDKKMWIVVSEGDFGAFPGMNASIDVWERDGARVVKGRWSAREPAGVQAANVARMAGEHNNIMYTVFDKGTTLPAGMENSGASEHLMSMRYAYAMPGIRDWLFQQSKGTPR
jgi:predicted peptidase